MKAPAVRLKWKDELAQQYQQNLLSADAQAKLKDAIRMIDIDINEALAMFSEILWENAKCMDKKYVVTTLQNWETIGLILFVSLLNV